MKTNKKISIKIKSKTERRIMEEPQVEIITEWNVKRIFIALLVILLLVIIPAYYLSSLNEEPVLKDIKQSDIETKTT
jgi:flagellar biogenesis protein FliO